MRTAYHQRLTGLTAQLAEMCQLARAAMQCASQALATADLGLASSVLRDQEEIALAGEQTRQDAFVLLALQAPVARDLRAVIATIQNAADIERMGSLALHIAEIAARRYPHPSLPGDLRRHFDEMGRIAENVGRDAQLALMSGDAQAAALVPAADEEMNRLHQRVLHLLVDGDHRYGTAVTVDGTLLSKFYERYADHAVEVARRVIYQATGQLPDPAPGRQNRGVTGTDGATPEFAPQSVAAASVEVISAELVAAGAPGNRSRV